MQTFDKSNLTNQISNTLRIKVANYIIVRTVITSEYTVLKDRARRSLVLMTKDLVYGSLVHFDG